MDGICKTRLPCTLVITIEMWVGGCCWDGKIIFIGQEAGNGANFRV